jgi:hypothetical protein
MEILLQYNEPFFSFKSFVLCYYPHRDTLNLVFDMSDLDSNGMISEFKSYLIDFRELIDDSCLI